MNASRQTIYPIKMTGYARPLETEPILLNGMQVLFDQPVAVYPVVLEEKTTKSGQGNENGSRASAYRLQPRQPGSR